jgi:hypothetical protein
MTLPKPDLDDRSFDDLVREAETLIPRYAPQWTDHNWSDPGITFIDLFSWLTEISVYRINQITDRHRLKYLKLLGTSVHPAVPAQAELTIDSTVPLTVPQGTVVCTEISDRKTCFELDEDIAVVPSVLKRIIVDEGPAGVFDRTAANEKGDQFFAPFGISIRKNCALYLGFDTPVYTIENAIISHKSSLPLCRDEPAYTVENAGTLVWEYSLTDGKWKEIQCGTDIQGYSDATDAFRKSGRILFIGLTDWEPCGIPLYSGGNPGLCWLRCTIKEPNFEYPPRLTTVRLNTVTATQGRVIRDDHEKRTGSGLPDQVFRLKYSPVQYRTLQISVIMAGDKGSSWTEVDDFDGSGPDDRHFVVDYRTGEVRFGDGLYGKVPEPGNDIIVTQYRIGGGEGGNIGAGQTWKIEEIPGKQPDNIPIVGIRNFYAASGGTEKESIDEAFRRVRRDLKIPYTAVTSEDFEKIAQSTPGLRVAKAHAFISPPAGSKKPDGGVTVVIVPYTPQKTFDYPPVPSKGFLNAICRHLDRHRLLGTKISVMPAGYVRVSVSVTIVPSDGYRDETVRSAVIDTLTGFLHPITGGTDHSGWPIGRMVARSELYNLLDGIDGVNCVIQLSISGDKGSFPDGSGNLQMPPESSESATVYPGTMTVTVTRKTTECRRSGRDYGTS